jgi:hypothetical protein
MVEIMVISDEWTSLSSTVSEIWLMPWNQVGTLKPSKRSDLYIRNKVLFIFQMRRVFHSVRLKSWLKIGVKWR